MVVAGGLSVFESLRLSEWESKEVWAQSADRLRDVCSAGGPSSSSSQSHSSQVVSLRTDWLVNSLNLNNLDFCQIQLFVSFSNVSFFKFLNQRKCNFIDFIDPYGEKQLFIRFACWFGTFVEPVFFHGCFICIHIVSHYVDEFSFLSV